MRRRGRTTDARSPPTPSARLGAITVIALGLCFLEMPLGLGVLAGLGIFQVVLLANMARSMFKMGSGGVGGMLDAASASFTLGDDGDND